MTESDMAHFFMHSSDLMYFITDVQRLDVVGKDMLTAVGAFIEGMFLEVGMKILI